VPLDREPRILRLHPFPVIVDPNLFFAAELDVNDDPAGAGIDGVLDEFFDDRRGTLDDFAGRNLIREIRGQTGDLGQS